ncbi:MAG TPA: hypothetical protein VF870_10490, partial [Ignavibacteriaceae bacterium]
MKKLFSMIAALTLLLHFLTVAQSNSPSSANNVQVAFPFYDDVETNATSSAYWDRDTLQWKIQITNAHSGTQVWAMLPFNGSYNYLTLASNIDLSSAPNPYLSFWVRKADGGGGYVSIEASNDGGNTWSTIWQPYFSGTLYNRLQVSLGNFRQANARIRIGCYGYSGGTYYIDDILIDNAPTPQPIVLSLPQN